ncbi:MAG: hydroxyisourate hydrolase [Thermostichales cyanobacterium BF4_bins_65]
MAGLTTHVLDIAQGIPAVGMGVRLVRVGVEGLLKQGSTNGDGRWLVLAPEEMQVGTYELWFGVGDYFRRQGLGMADPPFLGEVPIRFAVADVQAHYHVPLLVSPWAYSTYRGS